MEAARKWANRENAMDDWQLVSIDPFRLKVNFLPELHRLTCPVLYLRGENDPLVGQRVMEEAVGRTPGATLRVVKKAGHLLPLEQPGEVNKAVAEFLTENNIEKSRGKTSAFCVFRIYKKVTGTLLTFKRTRDKMHP